VGETVFTGTGTSGVVQSVNVLRQKVKLVIEEDDEKELIEVGVDELDFRPRKKNVKISAKEMEELEGITDETEDATADSGRDSNRENKDRDYRERRNNKNHRPHKNRGRDRGKDRTERGERTNPAGEQK
jgi:hypothetical protein